MKKLILMLGLLMPLASFAGIDASDLHSAGFNDLSESQKAAIITQVEKESQAKKFPLQDVELAEKWIGIGTQIGKGLAGASKELGIEANEFANTDVGKIATWTIVYNYMGKDVISMAIHVMGGFSVWAIGLGMVIFLVNRSRDEIIIYDDDTGKVIERKKMKLSESDKGAYSFIICCIILAGLFTMLAWVI